MMFFGIVLMVGLLAGVIAFFVTETTRNWYYSKKQRQLQEAAILAGIQLVFAFVAYAVASYSNTTDYENWNGIVVEKRSDKVSCDHSYQCMCQNICSGSGKNQTCTEVCQTCYEHSYDVDWTLTTSNGERIEIERIDRQGVRMPPRWNGAQIGEYTAVQHSYTNYVKAVPDSLFRHQGLREKYEATLPDYPGQIYDYYRTDRLVTAGMDVPDRVQWNHDLMRINSERGRAFQVDMAVVLVRNQPPDWFYALEEKWIGGKKNDAILVIDTDDAGAIQWVRVMAWITDEMFKVHLRDQIMDQKTLRREAVISAFSENVGSYFKRKPMKDFKYLEAQVQPTTLHWVFALLLAPLIAVGVTFLVFKRQLNLKRNSYV